MFTKAVFRALFLFSFSLCHVLYLLQISRNWSSWVTTSWHSDTIVPRILQLLPPLHSWLQEDCEAASQSHQDERSLLLQLSLYRSLLRTQEQAHFCLPPLALQYGPPYNGEDWRLRWGCCRNPLSAALWHRMILSSLLLEDYDPHRVQLQDSW